MGETMSDFLFSVGVFGDERTPRERAEKPVRCLEDELAPAVLRARTCGKCKINAPRADDVLCFACRRDRDCHLRTIRVRAAERLTARAKKSGFVDVSDARPDVVDYCVKRRWLARASVRDLRRLGMSPDPHIFLPVPYAE